MSMNYSLINNNNSKYLECLYYKAWEGQEYINSDVAEKLEIAREYALKNNLNNDELAYSALLFDLAEYYFQYYKNLESNLLIDELDYLFYKDTKNFNIDDYFGWLNLLNKKFTMDAFFGIDFSDEYDHRLNSEKQTIINKIKFAKGNNSSAEFIDNHEISIWYSILYYIGLVEAHATNNFQSVGDILDKAIYYNNLSLTHEYYNNKETYNWDKIYSIIKK